MAGRFNAAPAVFTALLTVVLPSKRPELRCNNSRARAGLMTSLFATSHIATAALIRIWSLIDPGQFGADRIETQTADWHEFRIVPKA